MIKNTLLLSFLSIYSLVLYSQVSIESNMGLSITNWSVKSGGQETNYNYGLGAFVSAKVKVYKIKKINLEIYPEIKFAALSVDIKNPIFIQPDSGSFFIVHKDMFSYAINYKVLDIGLGVYKSVKLNDKFYARIGFKILKNKILSQKTVVKKGKEILFKGSPLGGANFSFSKDLSASLIMKLKNDLFINLSYEYGFDRYVFFRYTDAQYDELNQFFSLGCNYKFN
jgi:hypothetical protein